MNAPIGRQPSARVSRIAAVPVRLALTAIWTSIVIVTSILEAVGMLAYLGSEHLRTPDRPLRRLPDAPVVSETDATVTVLDPASRLRAAHGVRPLSSGSASSVTI